MSKSQEQRMNELAEALGPKTSPNPIYDENYMPRQYFKSGYQAAMKEADVLVEAIKRRMDSDDKCGHPFDEDLGEALKQYERE